VSFSKHSLKKKKGERKREKGKDPSSHFPHEKKERVEI